MSDKPEYCVIFNPSAGRGRAPERMARLREVLGRNGDFRPTSSPGHAVDLAQAAAEEGFPVVAAAGGDGTVHEVANGLIRANAGAALAVIPVGSANDYAFSLGLLPDWWLPGPEAPKNRRVDYGEVSSPGGKRRYFINGLGIGFNGQVTWESRRIRWLQGVPLYAAALLSALCWHYDAPEMRITVDVEEWRLPTLAFTVALGQREGNFRLMPQALLDDGWFDYLHAMRLPRWELLRFVPGMITGHIPRDHPRLRIGRCRSVTVESSTPLIAHVDGEFFCIPEEKLDRCEIAIRPEGLPVHGRFR